MTPTAKTVLRRLPDIRYRRVGDEWVVIRQSSAEVFVLNEWAGRVLDLLDGTRSLEEIAELLSSEYDASGETVRADVLRFSRELAESGLGEDRGAGVAP